MKLRLKYTPYNDEWCLLEVIEQPENFKGFEASNVVQILSVNCPEYRKGYLYVRGHYTELNTRPFAAPVSALLRIKAAVAEYNRLHSKPDELPATFVIE